ncbi:Pentatricopeptide repeat-containing protein [Platanthera guangdongensis]|uniref:Pentatricopeptide repeat-containing protein n=1 Tax=Platanthera guangdongensis TaxID=2320717 RepID=A0ABR2LXN6_9ASPA
MSAPIRPPQFTSRRRLLEQKLSDLHKCSDPRFLLQIHSQIFRLCLHRDQFVAPKLVAAYSLCRRPFAAAAAFDLVRHPNSLLFNTLIRAFANNSLPSLSFLAFSRMQHSAIPADSFTYSFLLKSFSGHLRLVEIIHAHILKLGFLPDIFVPNSLLDSYSKAGETGLGASRKVFEEMPLRDVVSWNTMVAALVRAGQLKNARQMFDEMPHRDIVTWNIMLDGHAKAGELDAGFDLFRQMPERNVVSWSTVISGFCLRGDMETARMLFDKMPVKNLVTWTIMASGYAKRGFFKEASALLDKMEETRLNPDSTAIVSVLTACSESGLLGLGKRMHATAKKLKLIGTTLIDNSLVDLYSKCGEVEVAWSIFREMKVRDLVSWNSMIQGLAMNGHGGRALKLFSRMKDEGVAPDAVTFVGVLCACTHMGFVDDARTFFSSMEKDYGVLPEIEHYGCLIDLLGRRGILTEAYELAKTMPFEANAIIWGSLLNACMVHGDVGMAEKVVGELTIAEALDAGNYAIVSNIYASARRWDGMAEARLKMKDSVEERPSGASWIELDDSVHEFTAGYRLHPQTDRILKMLDRLGNHLKRLGCLAESC